MKVLVLVGNNLQYDTRVKRHIKAIADRADEVHVIGRAIDENETMHLSLPNLTHSFFKWAPLAYPATPALREMAVKLDVFDDIWPALPLLLEDRYYEPSVYENSFAEADKLMEGSRWAEILRGTPEESTLEQQVGWVIPFIDASVQWAMQAVLTPADVVYCNDIDTLLCGVAHKKKYKSRLIYDAHDIFCDMFPGIFPRQHRNFIGRLERALLPYADMLVSVNESAINWLKSTYHSPVPGLPVLNCTDDVALSPFSPKKLTGPLRIYYHGGCDATRGLQNIIRAVAQISNVHLVLRLLPSQYTQTLKELVHSLCAEEKVSFLAPVASHLAATAAHNDGDIGIHACDSVKCVDLEVSLTNKFIEYLRAGLPIITSDVVEQASIVRSYGAGYVLKNNSVEEMIRVIEQAKMDADCYTQKSENALRASAELFDWNRYRQFLQQAVFDEFTADQLAAFAEIKPLASTQELDERSCLLEEIAAWRENYRRELRLREETQEKYTRLQVSSQENQAHAQLAYERLELCSKEDRAREQEERAREQDHCAQLLESVTCLQAEREQLRLVTRDYQNLKRELEAMRASKSWKMTKPLRGLLTLIKK